MTCRFSSQCRNYAPDSFTCSSGGAYCGTYRLLEAEEKKCVCACNPKGAITNE